LLIGSLRHPVDGKVGVGVLDLYVLRRAKKRGVQGRPPWLAPERHQVDAERTLLLEGKRRECRRAAAPSPSWPAIA